MLRDVTIKLGMSLILSTFFIFIGVPFSMIDNIISEDKDFLKDLISVFFLIYIIITFISGLSNWLDKKYPWGASMIRERLALQLSGGVVLPSAFIWVYIYLYRLLILKMDPLEMEQFSSGDFLVAILVVIFINMYFNGLYFYRLSKERHADIKYLEKELFTLKEIVGKSADELSTGETRQKNVMLEEKENLKTEIDHKTKLKSVIAVMGNKNIPIPVEDIAYLYKEGNYIQLKTFRENTYLLNHTLEELMQLFDEQLFFRANRQFIVSLKACHFFTNEENGKLELHLYPEHKEEVIISQKRAQQFKDWLNR